MRDYYNQSILSIADYIIKTRCTVRECANVFGISKSAVHSYMRTKLKYIDVDVYDEVRQVLSYNLSVRHLRGGESTKRKYSLEKEAACSTVNTAETVETVDTSEADK